MAMWSITTILTLLAFRNPATYSVFEGKRNIVSDSLGAKTMCKRPTTVLLNDTYNGKHRFVYSGFQNCSQSFLALLNVGVGISSARTPPDVHFCWKGEVTARRQCFSAIGRQQFYPVRRSGVPPYSTPQQAGRREAYEAQRQWHHVQQRWPGPVGLVGGKVRHTESLPRYWCARR